MSVDSFDGDSVDVTCHVRAGGKWACVPSVSELVWSYDSFDMVVSLAVAVAETSYVHSSAYDDSLVTDDDDSCWGTFIRYT